jgi:hypothetical protein
MPFRKRTEPFREPKFFCVVCQAEVPPDRVIKKAVTCSKQHALDFKNMKRRMRDTDRCRLCNRPSSAEERAEFTQWRKEKRAAETAKRREEKKKEKAQAAPAATPLEEHLGTMQV